MQHAEILIIGGGPAGLTAGLYGARSGHKTAVVEKAFSGGQMALTADIENYPGFADPVNGMELAQAMERQAARFGCEFINAEATALRPAGAGFELDTTGGTLSAESVIICPGVKPRRLGVPGETELTGRGVSYCAVCDGPLFRGKEVAVIGGGDAALDEAYYLSNIAARVHLIHRRDEFRGSAYGQERLRNRDNVTLHLSHVCTRINGKERLEELSLQNRKDGSESTLAVNGLFIYIGWLPNTGWCSPAVTLDPDGFIVTDAGLRTSLPGVFAAGDVRTTPLRQVATAVGDGALAAMQAHDFLAARRP
jgi:thioredoxin reductase (NADPH)